jgi:hypothetical protein
MFATKPRNRNILRGTCLPLLTACVLWSRETKPPLARGERRLQIELPAHNPRQRSANCCGKT